MTGCQHVQRRLDDYVDGVLDRREAGVVEEHARDCATCALALEELTELRRRVAGLPRSVQPDRDLWPGIEGRIEGRRLVRGRFGPRRRPWLAAAAAAALLAVGAVAGYLAGRSGIDGPAPTAARADGGAALAVRHVQMDLPMTAATADFARARAELITVLQARRDTLPDDALQVVLENLEIIDQSIVRISRALEQDPDNVRLNRQLAAAYRQELSLLQRATRLPAEA